MRRAGAAALNALYVLVVLAIAAFVYLQFLRTSGIGVNGKATFEKMLTGTAYKPYVYRQLLPATANLLAPYVDGMAALRLGRRLENIVEDRFFRAQLNGRLYPRQVILILLMMYLSLTGFAGALFFLVRDFGYSRFIQYALPPAALLASMVYFGFGYMYDFTHIFLFTLGLWLMHRRAWGPYLLVFAIGVANKETTILLTVVFVIYHWSRMRRPRLLALTAAQLAIFAAIQGGLRYRFRGNEGGAVEWHFPDVVATFRELGAHSPGLLLAWAAILALIAVLIIRGWKQKPGLMRCGLWLLPLFLPLLVFWAYPLEIRDALELFPVIAILVLPAPGLSPPLPARGGDLH